jgi:hypothetical protein
MENRFPILCPKRTVRGCPHNCPQSIPFDAIEPHRRQAMHNHSQTLERLAQRGGLSVKELYAVMHDRDWFDLFGWGSSPKPDAVPMADCLAFVRQIEGVQ